MRFPSPLPETVGATETLKAQAWAEDRWKDVGRLSSEAKGAASYRVWEAPCELDGRRERALVVYSSSLDQRKGSLRGEVVEDEERVKRPRPGRPRKGEEPECRTVYRLEVEPVLQEGRLQEARRLASTFVLVTDAGWRSRSGRPRVCRCRPGWGRWPG